MKWRFIIFVIIYLCLFTAFIWSKDGPSTKLQLIKNGPNLTFFFEDKIIAQAQDLSSEKKKLKILFGYQDVESKYFQNSSSSSRNDIILAQNYNETVYLKNPFSVRLYFTGKNPYLFYINPYRHFDSGFEDINNVLLNKKNYAPQISTANGIKWIFWLLLKPFPYLSIIFFLIFAFYKNLKQTPIAEKTKKLTKPAIIIALSIAALSFFYSLYLMNRYTLGIPHVPDAVSYVLLAKMLSSGQMIIPLSQIPKILPHQFVGDFLHHWFIFRDNVFFVQYLVGHPALLAIGNIFGAMSLIPPLVGAATLVLVFYLTFKLTNSTPFSTIATLILFASPFFQTQTIDFMSHNTAAFYLLLSLLPLYRNKNNYFITGFFQGMLLNTRPLTAAATLPLLFIYIIIRLLKTKEKSTFFRGVFTFIAGLTIPLFIFFYYNHLTTGDIFQTPYAYHGIINMTALGTDFKLGLGLLTTFSSLTAFSLFFLRNYYVSFLPFLISLILVPLLGKQKFNLFFLQLLASSIVAIWTLYIGVFFIYGPRLIYEATPILAILYGVTFYHLFNLFERSFPKILVLVFFAIFFYNILVFELSWLDIRKPEYSGITFIPSTIAELKNFNSVEGKFLNIYKENKNKDKIFLMKNCANWWCTGEGIWLNGFPLTRSKPLFLTLPEKYNGELKNAQIIDWENQPSP